MLTPVVVGLSLVVGWVVTRVLTRNPYPRTTPRKKQGGKYTSGGWVSTGGVLHQRPPR